MDRLAASCASSLILKEVFGTVLQEVLCVMGLMDGGLGSSRDAGFLPPVLQRERAFVIAQQAFDYFPFVGSEAGFVDEVAYGYGFSVGAGREEHLESVLFDAEFLQANCGGYESRDAGEIAFVEPTGVPGAIETFVMLRDEASELRGGIANPTDQRGSDGGMLATAFLGIVAGVEVATDGIALAADDEPAGVLQQTGGSDELQLRIIQPGHSSNALNIQSGDDTEDEAAGNEGIAVSGRQFFDGEMGKRMEVSFQRAGLFEHPHAFQEAIEGFEPDLILGVRPLVHENQNEFAEFSGIVANLMHAGNLLPDAISEILPGFHQLIEFGGGDEGFFLSLFGSLQFAVADAMEVEHAFAGRGEDVAIALLERRIRHDILRLAEHPAELAEKFLVGLGDLGTLDGAFGAETIEVLLPEVRIEADGAVGVRRSG